MGLTTKQRLFVQHYLESYNATQAAILAGYSERSARSIAAENLAKPDIRAEVQRFIETEGMGAIERLFTLSTIARDKEQRTGDRLKAIEMLGKLNGDYIEKVQDVGEQTITVSIVHSDENEQGVAGKYLHGRGAGVFIPDNGRD